MQQVVSVVVGAVVTFLLLLLFQGPDGPRIVGDSTQGFLVAVVVGALVTLVGPIVAGWYLRRRREARQQRRIESEVERRITDDRGR
jgi:hypothetical protein